MDLKLHWLPVAALVLALTGTWMWTRSAPSEPAADGVTTMTTEPVPGSSVQPSALVLDAQNVAHIAYVTGPEATITYLRWGDTPEAVGVAGEPVPGDSIRNLPYDPERARIH